MGCGDLSYWNIYSYCQGTNDRKIVTKVIANMSDGGKYWREKNNLRLGIGNGSGSR